MEKPARRKEGDSKLGFGLNRREKKTHTRKWARR